MLNLDGVSKSYDHASGKIPVLNQCNAAIEQGQKVAIVGPSGSGKSTLLLLLAGLDRPTGGRISILGQSIGDMSEKELARFRQHHLGIVFQQFHLMAHLTALENVALPLRILRDPKAWEKAAQELEAVGLGHRLEHFPHQMSGGENQRVAIARATVTRPKLLLADEPSGNLDSKTGTAVMQLLFDLVTQHKITLILVTHNDSLAAQCDLKLTIREGHLVHV